MALLEDFTITYATDSLTGRVADFIVGGAPANAPEGTDRHVVRAFINWLGCTIGGSRDESVSRLLAVMDCVAGAGQATVCGRNRKLDMAHAALANGFASNALDFDDMHVPTLIHPTGPVVAAALSVAEAQRDTGRALLDAILIGIEVELHIGRCLFPDHYDRGWHITATAGVLGAAAAASALMGLDRERVALALAMAATQAGGLRAMLPNEGKNLNVGLAAHGGVLAALLAKQGLGSAPAIFDEPFGYFSVFEPRADFRELLRELGHRFLVSEISLKPYPCGVVIHPVIDACISISRRSGFDCGAIRSVDIHVHPRTAVLAEKPDPGSLITSRFSLHHAAALALTFGAADFDTFERSDVADPGLTALRKRFVIQRSDEMTATQAKVIVNLVDGSVLEEHVTKAVGGPENPLSDNQLKRKFTQLCGRVMDGAAAESLFAQCLALHEVVDVGEFVKMAMVAAWKR